MTTTPTEHELNRMSLRELQSRFREVVGEETRCPNKTFLVRRILSVLGASDDRTSERSVAPGANLSSPGADTDATATHDTSMTESLSETPEQAALVQTTDMETSENESHRAVRSTTDALEEGPQTVVDSALEEAPQTVVEPGPITEAIPPRLAIDEDNAPSHSKVPAGNDTVEAAEAVRAAPPATPAQHLGGGRRGRFRAMSVAQLQTLYLSTVGRSTSSTDRRYLEWKIREAEKGRIPVGPREQRTSEHEASDDVRVLPLRLDGAAVDALDATWKSHGMKSRMDFFRRALGHYLAHLGASGAAMHFTSQSTE